MIVGVLKGNNHLSAAMAALYLRGAPRTSVAPPSRWPKVLSALRESPAHPQEALRDGGLWLEATILEDERLLRWADEQIQSGRCLTVGDEDYPLRWLSVLGHRAPAAVWCQGRRSLLHQDRWLSIVGSRSIQAETMTYVRSVTDVAVSHGYGIVSGQAVGCDRVASSSAEQAGGPVVEILPYGLSSVKGNPRSLLLSVCAPDDLFTRGAAMERNALIYAFSPCTAIGHVRFREGGTWHGAVDALRRRLSRVLVPPENDPAVRALISLGAVPISGIEEIPALLQSPPSVRCLFSLG